MLSEIEKKRLFKLYEFLEVCFSILLHRINIPSEVKTTIEEYVYHREYGVAFEYFVAMCKKNGIVFSDDLEKIVEQMANEMGYNLEQLRKQFS